MRRILVLALFLAGVPFAASGASRVLTVSDTTRLANGAAAIEYFGAWQHVRGKHDGRSNGASARSRSRGSFMRLRFRGSRLELYGVLGPSGGYGLLSIDRTTAGRADFWDWHVTPRAMIYRAWGLKPGVHELTVYVEGARNAKSSGTYVNIDSVDLADGSVARLTQRTPAPHSLKIAPAPHRVAGARASTPRDERRTIASIAALLAVLGLAALVVRRRSYARPAAAVPDGRTTPVDPIAVGPSRAFEIAVFRPSQPRIPPHSPRRPLVSGRAVKPPHVRIAEPVAVGIASPPPSVRETASAPAPSEPAELDAALVPQVMPAAADLPSPMRAAEPRMAEPSATAAAAPLAVMEPIRSALAVPDATASLPVRHGPSPSPPDELPPIAYPVPSHRRIPMIALPVVALAGFMLGIVAMLTLRRREE